MLVCTRNMKICKVRIIKKHGTELPCKEKEKWFALKTRDLTATQSRELKQYLNECVIEFMKPEETEQPIKDDAADESTALEDFGCG